jgi:hypothetical protein
MESKLTQPARASEPLRAFLDASMHRDLSRDTSLDQIPSGRAPGARDPDWLPDLDVPMAEPCNQDVGPLFGELAMQSAGVRAGVPSDPVWRDASSAALTGAASSTTVTPARAGAARPDTALFAG